MELKFTDITGYLPNGFNLRSGAGGGDPRNGLCFNETVALIAGEKITDHPACACPVIATYSMILNDALPPAERQRLLPLAWAAAGTRSPKHKQARLKILGLAACDIAEMVLPIFEKHAPDDRHPRDAIKAARAYWKNPTASAAARAAALSTRAAARAAEDALSTRDAAWSASAAAWSARDAWAASIWAEARDASAAAWSAWAAWSAARAATAPAAAAWTAIHDRAITALREAILAGPHGGLPDEDVRARIDAVSDRLPVSAQLAPAR